MVIPYLSAKIPAITGAKTPPTNSPAPAIKPIPYPVELIGSVSEGIAENTTGTAPNIE